VRELNRVMKTGPGVRLGHLGHGRPALIDRYDLLRG